jgi:hypothetical protein
MCVRLHGLTYRHLVDTVCDTLAWYNMTGAANLKSGLAAADEIGVLEAWRTSHL